MSKFYFLTACPCRSPPTAPGHGSLFTAGLGVSYYAVCRVVCCVLSVFTATRSRQGTKCETEKRQLKSDIQMKIQLENSPDMISAAPLLLQPRCSGAT
ncbi:unnamed protein product [Pleuronectes platessa]|uniref:Uncharacterized protein n=1 Tax=Pleuronectes platessa TaxID=8262 RepID=A0A9N7YVD5_PLEPL|nr:unnamed protein product [Pleuronectes platessa]